MTYETINDATTMRGMDSTMGRIDQYELLRELGGGGFGTVYLAKDTVAGIEVAVKGLPPIIRNNAEELERIRENFALVSRLHHPYIAAALHLQLAREVHYASEDVRQKLRVMPGDTLMVMEYAPGVTLSKWRKQFPGGRVPLEQAIQLVWQVAQALDYAHEQHILHRDVKPSNIMVETKPDGEMVARLLDFGLAAEIRSSMGRVSREIRDTSGTRPYMAPEQWEGRKQGPATDQYALAVLLCELLTGEVPFASVFETGDPVVMMTAVCNREVELPVDCPCQIALRRALAKNPLNRFANCMEFVEAAAENKLELRQDGDSQVRNEYKETVPRREYVNSSLSRLWGGKSHLAIAGLVLSVIAVVGGIFWFLQRQQQLAKARRYARIVAEQNREAERREAERKSDEERKIVERRKSQKEAKEKAETDHNKNTEKTLQFISAYETGKYDAAARLMGSINSDSAEVQFDIAKMYENGWGVTKDDVEAVRWYRKAAEQGYDKAQNNLGVKCRDGRGTERDLAEALRWFRRAAEQGDAISQSNIGAMYRDGNGVKRSYPEAIRWFRMAADQGDALAQFYMAGMYFAGWGVAEDANEGVKWLRKAVNQNSVEAQYVLGLCYATGNGIVKDLSEAAKWYRKAAEQGNMAAQNELGLCYEDGKGVTQDKQEAVHWYRKAAEQGFARSQTHLGRMYLFGVGVTKNYADALHWLQISARQEDAGAQYILGTMYVNGLGVAKDYSKAVEFFRRAAEQANASAQNRLGLMYFNGEGVTKNFTEAALWFRKAAEQENAEAQGNLGVMYVNGWGVEKDLHEAVKWFRKAANQNNADAQYHLGLCYANGNGVAKNLQEAEKWCRKAAEQGNTKAQKALEELSALGSVDGEDQLKHRTDKETSEVKRCAEEEVVAAKDQSHEEARESEPRKEECTLCGGTGVVDCSRCKGSGTIVVYGHEPCPICSDGERRGYVKRRVKCERCGGRGQITRRCGTCRGKGFVRGSGVDVFGKRRLDTRETCSSCGGSGKGYPQPCQNCFGGSGEVEVWQTCGRCRGSGKVSRGNGETCPNCSGKGKFKCDRCSGRGFTYRPKEANNSTISK